MTYAEYAVYARLFDAVLDARAIDRSANIQLHGNVAGSALRTWAASRRLDVGVEIGELASIGTWTKLVLTTPGDISWVVVVHLSDNLTLEAPRLSLVPPPEAEIPF